MNKQQIRLANLAEREIFKYRDDLVLWFKHICNVMLRAPQIVWMEEVLKFNRYLNVAPPRMGKTMLIELIDLYESATTPFEDGRIWAPKESQAIDSLRYQRDPIKNSEILYNYLDWESGKRMFSSTRYQFVNKSNWQTFGIYGEFEGVNATIIRGEEFDDLDIERFENRVIPRGGAKNRNGKPTRIRLTGTIQEAKGNIFHYDTNGTYKMGTKFPIEIGLELGYYDEEIIQTARDNLTAEEFDRIYRLKYTSGRNFIWEDRLEKCQYRAKEIGWEGIEFSPGGKYHPTGRVFCGFDCGHSGSGSAASVFSLQIYEAVGDSVLWLNGKNWDSTADPVTLLSDILEWWDYFGVQNGYGDALKSDFIASVNDQLYDNRLIRTDRKKFPENSAPNWYKWDFSPVWNTGKAKYLFAGILKNKIEASKWIIPRFDRKDDRPIAKAGKLLCSRLLNVREEKNKSNYPSLDYINPKLGDDDFDASIMAAGVINDKGGVYVDLSKIKTTGKKTEFGGVKGIGSEFGRSDSRSGFESL